MLTELLSKVVSRRKAREGAAVAGFDELVQRLADNEQVDDEEVDRVLDEAGKTVEDMRKAVELIQKRREWRKILGTEREATEAAQALEQERRGNDLGLVHARQYHAQKAAELDAKFAEQIQPRLSAIAQAKHKLQTTAHGVEEKDRPLAEEATRLTKELSGLVNDSRNLADPFKRRRTERITFLKARLREIGEQRAALNTKRLEVD